VSLDNFSLLQIQLDKPSPNSLFGGVSKPADIEMDGIALNLVRFVKVITSNSGVKSVVIEILLNKIKTNNASACPPNIEVRKIETKNFIFFCEE